MFQLHERVYPTGYLHYEHDNSFLTRNLISGFLKKLQWINGEVLIGEIEFKDLENIFGNTWKTFGTHLGKTWKTIKKQVEKLWQKRKQHINNDSSSSDSESERTGNNTQASTIDDQVQIEISEVILIFLNEIYY